MKDLVRARRRAPGGRQEPEPVEAESDGSRGGRINPTLSLAAIAEAQNALDAAHASGDYHHQSLADLIRAALRAYSTGLALTRQSRDGRRRRHTVELPGDLIEQYRKLPSRSRGVIIERALLSLLARGLDS